MHAATEESDTWQDLPEFDADLEDPESDAPLEVSIEISELEESDALDRDDSNAQDLDVGVELELSLDSAQEAGGQDLVLDIGQLLDAQEERAADPTDDAAGPLGFDATTDVPALDEEQARAADEDLDSDLDDDGLDEELPGMDADEEGDFGDDVSSLWSSAEFVADETVPAWSAERWLQRDENLAVGSLAAVTCSRGTVVAGGRELIWCGQDEKIRHTPVEGGSVVSLALGGATDSLLYTTALGRLMRRRAGGSAEPRDGWRADAGLSSRAVVLELSQPSAHAPETVLMRTSTGQLLCSEDFGTTFFALTAPGNVVALSAQSDPARALVDSSSGLLLAEVDVARRSLRCAPLDRAAEVVARGHAPRVCALGSLVAIADETRGVAISYDSGQRFALVPGTSNASAWAAGEHAGAPSLWLSVLEESTSQSWILRITAGAAERIGELRRAASKDVEESSDNVRVSALCWDKERAVLWAVGGFGIVSWCLPKDEKK